MLRERVKEGEQRIRGRPPTCRKLILESRCQYLSGVLEMADLHIHKATHSDLLSRE